MSEKHFRRVLKTAPDAMLLVRRDGTIAFANEQAERTFGYPEEELLGLLVDTLVPQRFRQRHAQHREAYLADPRVRPMGVGLELFGLRKDGSEFPAEISLSSFESEDGLVVSTTIRDVTERKRVEEALRKSDERLRLLLEGTHVIPWEADAKTLQFTYVGPQAVEILGYPLERWYEEEDFWPSHIHPEDRDYAIDFCQKKSSGGCKDYEFEYRMIASDGNSVWLHDLATVEYAGAEPQTLRGFMIDITERMRAEETLKDLRRRLIHAQEEERRHLARELHDDLNQRLASLTIEMGMLRQGLPEAAEPIRDQLTSVQEQLMELSENVRHMSHELHPGTLEHLGLARAIQAQCREFREHAGIRTEVSVQLDRNDIATETALCVYRVTQEALHNIARHSAAKEVRVTLTGTDCHIELSIADSGVGFASEQVNGHAGLGLVSMEERVRLLGGTFSVQSEPGEGTQVKVSLPLLREES